MMISEAKKRLAQNQSGYFFTFFRINVCGLGYLCVCAMSSRV